MKKYRFTFYHLGVNCSSEIEINRTLEDYLSKILDKKFLTITGSPNLVINIKTVQQIQIEEL